MKMTKITYKDGIVTVSQHGVTEIRFRMCDLDYDSRVALAKGASGLSNRQIAGVIGFLKTQPIEVRQEALEQALGVSFPCGVGDDEILKGADDAREAYKKGEYDTLQHIIEMEAGE